jgi:hypothetical protein
MAHAPPARPSHETDGSPEAGARRFQVELDKRGQVHVHCVQGRDTVTSIGLTTAGFNSLVHQGLMRKPRSLQIGALHDWVELDGELCSFEKGRNDAARLEQLLNERYASTTAFGVGKEVVVLLNAASPTGFDIQFPVMVAGQPDHHRHHLDDHALERLQDPDHCGLLHKQIIVKLIPPNLVFKRRTPDGGEQYLTRVPENTLTLTDDDGRQKVIDLTQPLNVMRLSPAELTAIFNHPAINQHSKAAAPAGAAPANVDGAGTLAPGEKQVVAPAPLPPDARPVTAPKLPGPSQAPLEVSAGAQSSSTAPRAPVESAEPEFSARMTGNATPESVPKPPDHATPDQQPEPSKPLPNLWLENVLAQPELRHDWFACLVYSKMAERFGNSREGKFGPGACWFISLGETEDIDDPAFKGIFLTEKGGFGFLNAGQMARFYNGVAFVGTQKWALEGIQVNLVAAALDAHERVVFILNDDYRAKFGVPDSTLGEVLERLTEHGSVLMSVAEALASREPLTVVWTVPMEQANPNDPEALESHAPEAPVQGGTA